MENRNAFRTIFGPQPNKEDGHVKTISLRTTALHVPDYNSTSTRTAAVDLKRHSMETVYAFDNDAFAKGEEGEERPKSPDDRKASPPPPSGPHTATDAAAKYDPHEHGNTHDPTSFWGTVFHLVIVSAGPAVLSIPIMFVAVGNVVGFFLTLATVAFYAYNVNTIVRSEYELCRIKRVPNFSYPQLAYHAFHIGPPCTRWFAFYAKYLVNVVFIAIWFGSTCYGSILIGQNLQVAYDNLYHAQVDFHTMLALVFVPLLLLTWIRKLSHLVPFSILANALNVISFLFVVYYVFADPSPWHFENNVGSLANLPLFLGTVLFTVNATGIVLPLKNEMRYPTKFASAFGVVNVSYVLTALLYAFFSLLCGLKYGKSLRESVIENVPNDQPLAQVIIILSTLALIFQYPLIMYVAFDTIWNTTLKQKRKTLAFPVFWEYVLRTVLVILSSLIAYAVPDVSLFLSFCGTVGTSIDSLIFPALIQTLVLWKTSRSQPYFKWVFLKNAIIVIFSLILVIVGVDDCLKKLIS